MERGKTIRLLGLIALQGLLYAAVVASCAAPGARFAPGLEEPSPVLTDVDEDRAAESSAGGPRPSRPPSEPDAPPAPGVTADRPASPRGPLRKKPPVAPVTRPAPAARAPGMKAGWSDDNKQFNHFLSYTQRFDHVSHLRNDVSTRIGFLVRDQRGRPLPNCVLSFRLPNGQIAQTRRTYPDGRVYFYPSEDERMRVQGLSLEAECLGRTLTRSVDALGLREIELKFDLRRPATSQVPLDVAFLLDTTGSMGDEIERLKATLEAIHFQISNLPSKPDVRFGMVLYRDKGDAYRTRITPFTRDLEVFRKELARVSAGGGGDGPEDLQEGLKETIEGLGWREGGARLAFLLADAQPHLDYGQDYTYVKAMRRASEKAIKVVAIGASGLTPSGEMVFRQLAQYTQGLFVFLTYGEKGESDGGRGAAVSHHTGSNWRSRDLDAIVVQMVRKELSHFGDKPLTDDAEYWETEKDVAASDVERVRDEIFGKSVAQLVKYSSMALRPRTPVAVLPVAVRKHSAEARARAELVEERILLALGREPSFQVVERRHAQSLLDEMRRSGSDLFDSAGSARVGKMVGAQLVLISKLTSKKERAEVFIKLVRVETGEVLSLTLAKMDPKLLQ